MGRDFQFFKDVHQSVRLDVAALKESSYLHIKILGYIYDVTHGPVEEAKT